LSSDIDQVNAEDCRFIYKLCFIYMCVITLEVHCVSEWTPAALSASSLDRM